MSSGRITSHDPSGLSFSIGIGVALLLIAGVLYFLFIAHARVKETIGFDSNRPVPSDEVLKARLKPEQFRIVRLGGTERPFKNDYWDNERTGIYVDIITGEPLFTSLDKLKSVTGQLEFAKPTSKDLITEKLDPSHDMQRTEVRARRSDAHLGYLFPETTSPTGQSYTVNSGAFRFIPYENMEKQGFGEYLSLLQEKK